MISFKLYFFIAGVLNIILSGLAYQSLLKHLKKEEGGRGEEVHALFSVIPVPFLIILQFLVGFIVIPLFIPIKIRGIYLSYKLWRIRRQNKIQHKINEKLKSIIEKEKN